MTTSEAEREGFFAHEVVDRAFGEKFAAHGIDYWNGSGECEPMRQEAAANLRGAISYYNYSRKGRIAEPDEQLIAIVGAIAKCGEDSRYSMLNTYDAIRDVVAVHMQAARLAPEEQKQLFAQTAQKLALKIPAEHRDAVFSQESPTSTSAAIEVVGSPGDWVTRARQSLTKGGVQGGRSG